MVKLAACMASCWRSILPLPQPYQLSIGGLAGTGGGTFTGPGTLAGTTGGGRLIGARPLTGGGGGGGRSFGV